MANAGLQLIIWAKQGFVGQLVSTTANSCAVHVTDIFLQTNAIARASACLCDNGVVGMGVGKALFMERPCSQPRPYLI